MLNVKLEVNLDLKRFSDFKTCYLLFSPWTPLPTRLVFLKSFAYLSKKRVIYLTGTESLKPCIVHLIRNILYLKCWGYVFRILVVSKTYVINLLGLLISLRILFIYILHGDWYSVEWNLLISSLWPSATKEKIFPNAFRRFWRFGNFQIVNSTDLHDAKFLNLLMSFSILLNVTASDKLVLNRDSAACSSLKFAC